MSEYDLRSAFPLHDKAFVVSGMHWVCRLAEVSDLRPEADRLSWYLVFEPESVHDAIPLRKLEIITSATHLLESGWGADLPDRIVEWLLTGEADGRQEWLDY
jgi:hypothetical protein